MTKWNKWKVAGACPVFQAESLSQILASILKKSKEKSIFQLSWRGQQNWGQRESSEEPALSPASELCGARSNIGKGAQVAK